MEQTNPYLALVRENLITLQARHDDLVARGDALRAKIERGGRRPTDQQASEMERLTGQLTEVCGQIADAQAREAELELAEVRANAAAKAPVFIRKTSSRDVYETRSTGNRDAADLALRALDVLAEERGRIDGAEPRPELRQHFERHPDFAEQFRAQADPHYLSAFMKMVGIGDAGRATLAMTDAERAAMHRAFAAEQRTMSTSGSAGGFGIPQLLDPAIVIRNDGTVNPVRQVARIVTGVGTEWKGVSSTGITASWDAELAAVSDDSPTLAQPSISAHKGAAFVPWSIELEQDYAELTSELLRLLADARDRLEGTAFISGSGSGQPYGIMTRLEANTAADLTCTTAGTIGADDIRATFAALPARYRPNSAWMSSISVQNAVRAIGDDKLGNQTVDMTAGYNWGLLGRPYYENSNMDEMVTTTAANSFLVVGDWNEYVIFDRLGSARVELAPMLFDVTYSRPTGSRGFYYYWRTGADLLLNSTSGEAGFRYLANKTS